MLKLNASYSKKVPVPGQEYSSQSYHAAMEVELSDALAPEEIRERIAGTFATVREAVERELGGGADRLPAPRSAASQGGGRSGGGKGDGASASNRQIKYLNDLAAGQGIGVRQLNARLAERYGVSSAYGLSRQQASEIIDALQGGGGRKAA